MKNPRLILSMPLTWAALFFSLFAASVSAQEAKLQGTLYTITIGEDSSCWTKSPHKADTLRVINRLACHFKLTLGSDSIIAKNNGATDFGYTLSADKKTMLLDNGKKWGLLEEQKSDVRFRYLGNNPSGCKIKDDTQIKFCPTGDGKESTSANTTKATTFLFIPTKEEEAKFWSQIAQGETVVSADTCCPGAKELVFDYQAQCFVPDCDLEECMCRKCRRELDKKQIEAAPCDTCEIAAFKCRHKQNSLRYFHPQVGQAVRIRVKGLNPYRDWVNLHTDFYDRNKEGKAEFRAMLSGKGKPDSIAPIHQPNASSGGAKAHSTPDRNTRIERTIPVFRDEMAQFYREKYNLSSLSTEFLALCIKHIQGRIQFHFQIPLATPELMTAKLNVWLDSTTAAANNIAYKEKYRAILKEGIATYLKILNYQTTSAHLFQIKNSDMTKIGFEWYRNGVRVADKIQTFEFFNKGGFTIDYSAGIAINGLVNDDFTTIATPDPADPSVTKYQIVRKRGSQLNIGPVLLAHAYYRYPIANRFKIGATTGFMTNTRDNDFGLNFLFGGSLLFGSEERFNLTGGLVIGKVTRLAEELSFKTENGMGTLLDAPNNQESTDVPTREIYRTQWFVGVTYNLGN